MRANHSLPPLRKIRHSWLLALLGGLALHAADLSDRSARTEHVIRNLSSGPPADPLPPLRANHPSATEMAAKPKRHPYLFFDAESRPALRDRAKAEPFAGLAQRLRTHADDCLIRAIPAPATIRDDIPQFLANGAFNPAYLREFDRNQFGADGYLMAEVIPTLGFAFQLTGDRKYADVGRKWLLSLASWRKFGTKGHEADFDAGHFAYALALGYDWLWETLVETEREQVRDAMTRIAGPMIAQARYNLDRREPNLARGYMEGNHPRRTHGLFSLASLALLYETPAAREWVDIELQYQRDRLYPSAFAPDGEHADAWDHIQNSLDDPTPFAVALQRMGGEDLFNDPLLVERFRGLPRFFLYGMEQRLKQQWSCSTWFALASRLRDPLAQWIATRPSAFRFADEIMSYLFYDPSVPAIPPIDPSGSIYFPYSGWVKMCTGWSDGVLISFRCGPEIPKDQGDENGFRLWAGGEWLLPRLIEARRGPKEPAEVTWDFLGWYHGSPAQNIVLPDPDQIGDETAYEKTGRIPIAGGFQFGENPPMKGREYGRQWLSGPEILKNGDLRVVALDDAVDYVCGEAHRAFASSRPNLWVRHILFVKAPSGALPPYILICDELESGDQPQTFAWQIHPKNPFTRNGSALSIVTPKAGLEIHLLAPLDGLITEKQTPSPTDETRTRFIQWRTPQPLARCVYLTALVPHSGKAPVAPVKFRVIEAAGGWAVEARSGEAVDLAIFRSERAKTVEASGLSSEGAAALLRKGSAAEETLYTMSR